MSLPVFPYGSVYFRRTNPPQRDWERDYRRAAEDGWTVFRHWFLWSAVEIAPGVFDWGLYDRHLDLAAEYGLKTIIQEKITSAPAWAFATLPEARLMDRWGRYDGSQMSHSCVAGGFPGLNLNHPGARELAGNFLTQLADRYKDHPGLGYYDIVNEAKFPQNQAGKAEDYDFSPPTIAAFRVWLREKYGELGTLSEAWGLYGITDWSQIDAPRKSAFYPNTLDWLDFRVDNAIANMRWRAETIRAVDPATPITSHGQATSLQTLSTACSDDWRSAQTVDIFGFTFVQSRQGIEPYVQWHAVDTVRAASRGKDFWHAEHQGGPVWFRPFQIGRPREDGRIREPEDIRLSNVISMAGGARGIMYPRMRPLLGGPSFNSLAPYDVDGAATDRSAAASALAGWVRDYPAVWEARPVRGELGIAVVPESQHYAYAMHGKTQLYTQSMRGAYKAFFDLGFQPDWAVVDQWQDYPVLYLPFPVRLKGATRDALERYVAGGGTLICEALPGYFDDRGYHNPEDVAAFLDRLFGARQTGVEFFPDLLDGVHIVLDDALLPGGAYVQSFAGDGPTFSNAGPYMEGRRAAVFGRRTALLGTFCGYGYLKTATLSGFRAVADWAGLRPRFGGLPEGVVARLHGDVERVLWLVNANRESVAVTVPVDAATITPLRGEAALSDGMLTTTVRGRDAVVIRYAERA